MSTFVDGRTSAYFSDSVIGSGTFQVDGDPSLNYDIRDRTKNTKVQYQISYQVEWMSDFDHIDISLDNQPNGNDDSPGQDSQHWYGLEDRAGTLTTDSYGGHGGETFEFIFRVYDTSGTKVIEEIVTDRAEEGSDGPGDGDFGNTDSPKVDSFTIYDYWTKNGGYYEVEYFVSNTNDFEGEVRVRFEAPNWNSKKGSEIIIGSDLSTDRVSYGPSGGKSRTWNIYVEVVDTDGLIVDSGMKEDEPDGTNEQWP